MLYTMTTFVKYKTLRNGENIDIKAFLSNSQFIFLDKHLKICYKVYILYNMNGECEIGQTIQVSNNDLI